LHCLAFNKKLKRCFLNSPYKTIPKQIIANEKFRHFNQTCFLHRTKSIIFTHK
jgi:hypothetical protein